ncbi:hypothetical protein FB451DRAFT_1365482 [Mycena latifolia]|nr:hypothetical protein FB451DRAFT_1365482 [Mycena latifolia]
MVKAEGKCVVSRGEITGYVIFPSHRVFSLALPSPRRAASQAQPSQTQRSQERRAKEPEEPEEEEEEEEEEGRNMRVDDDEERGGDDDIKRAAHALVRLAMFAEPTACRSAGTRSLRKAMLGSNGRAFTRVFNSAQAILRTTHGMELVELCSRAELDKDTAQPTNGKEGDSRLPVLKKKGTFRTAHRRRHAAAAAGSKTYILHSTLNEHIMAQAELTHEAVLEAEAVDAASDDDDDDDEFGGSAAHGSIISWSSADQLGPIGILYVILALILVRGRVMSDPPTAIRDGSIVFSATSMHRALTLDAYRTALIRQGFLDRQQVGDAERALGGMGKCARVAQADDDAGQTYEWRWGTRAQSEVSEQAVAAFVAEFMVGDDARDEPDEEEESAAACSRASSLRRAGSCPRLDECAGGMLCAPPRLAPVGRSARCQSSSFRASRSSSPRTPADLGPFCRLYAAWLSDLPPMPLPVHRQRVHAGPGRVLGHHPFAPPSSPPQPEVEHVPAPLAVVSTDAAAVYILAPLPVVLVDNPPIALTRSALILARLGDDTDSDSSSDYTDSDDDLDEPIIPSPISTQPRVLLDSRRGNLRRAVHIKRALAKISTPQLSPGKPLENGRGKRLSVRARKEKENGI